MNTFLYLSVKHAHYIEARKINSSEILPVKELLVSSVRPNRFYQVVEHRTDNIIECIDQQSNTVCLHINDVRVVNCYE